MRAFSRLISRRATWIAPVCIVGLAAVATSAWAVTYNNMWPGGTGYAFSCYDGGTDFTGPTNLCLTDNATFSAFRESSLIASGTFGQVLSEQYEPTVLSVNMPATATYTGDSETDLIYQQRASTPAAGITWCNDATSYARCDQMYNAFYTNLPAYEIICHETGHAVGLLHGPDSAPPVSYGESSLGCMTTNPVAYRYLGSHNASEINSTYG